jgi:hypothetical protein
MQYLNEDWECLKKKQCWGEYLDLLRLVREGWQNLGGTCFLLLRPYGNSDFMEEIRYVGVAWASDSVVK